jgi:tetratricopeptide (TPR) repeat protein
VKRIKLLILSFFISATSLFAQDQLKQARIYMDLKQYDIAIPIYKTIYEQNPLDVEMYNEYLGAILADKKYKDAQELVEKQLKITPQNALLYIDLGKIFIESGKEKKATEPFDKAVSMINGDDFLTTKLAKAFIELHQDKYAIKTYERALEILHSPFLYANPLARLYSKTGDIEKAVNAMLTLGPGQMPGMEDTKSTLLVILGNDPKKLQLAQKALIKKINEQPENAWYAELLTWLYTQKDDWEGALMQVEALDSRLKENGERLLEFSMTAVKEKQYDMGIRALDLVVEKGKEKPLFAIAKAQKLNAMMMKLRDNPAFKPEEVKAIEKEFEVFFAEFPQYYNTETLRDYATLEAQYLDNPAKGIELLEKAIQNPGTRRDFAGWAKLQLGDYYVLSGKIWDASLLYSQVDKDFREDQLGEEARFRNAKLSYYRGDFEWAQGQLSVLKASTSELIANDALYLSVLITENIPPDSNLVPLRRFAYADLLLFQNKDKEAEKLLDSLATAFPKHPLSDDIIMMHARIAEKHRDYPAELNYLKMVYDPCKDCSPDDLLRDDALFKTAEVYEKYLNQPEEAKKYYERLIIDYPGSTYVQVARVKLAELQNVPVPQS